MKPTPAPALPERAARHVLLMQAFETGAGASQQWSAEDRAWATRLARETTPGGAPPERFLYERSLHALQRLAPRDAALHPLLTRRTWRWAWVALALLLGLLGGLAVNAIGGGQRINLLAPPVWALIAWNLLVYLSLLLPVPHLARRWLKQRLLRTAGGALESPLARFRAAWARQASPLLGARAALLLHVAAAALAAGLVAGLYVRGLVLDYRAGWQSTFLEPTQVRALLAALLAPAVALTGIGVPDADALQALRVAPDALPVASAARWIHLYAAMLGLFVVLPRTVLALVAARRARKLTRRLPLALGDPYFQRLLLEHQGKSARVQVLPHGTAPLPQARACLQAVLGSALGSGVQLSVAPATAYGNEDAAAALLPASGTTLRVALVDLSATPEDDTHGAFLRALQSGAPVLPLLLMADEATWRMRFAALPARIAERRGAWQRWAQAQGLRFVSIDLAQPDLVAAERSVQAALQP